MTPKMGRTPGTLRVLRASPRVPPLIGGQEIHVAELSRSLAALGLEQTLLFAGGAPDIPGVQTLKLHVPAIPSDIVRDSLFGSRLARHASEGFQIVHTHGDAPVARGGAITARRLGATHVHTFHGDLIPRGVRASVLRALLPKRSWYLPVSRRIASSLVGAGVDPARIFVRTSGVRAEFFRHRETGRRPNVVVGGRLIPEKGILDLARAWARANTGDSCLLVFGSGPEAAALERLAHGAENVVWLGELQVEAVSKVLTEAAAGIVMGRLPSATRSNEGTPTLALEMLAAGCYPVVGSTTGDAPRIVRGLRFGEVSHDVPAPTDIAELALRWSRTEAEPERARAQALAESRFSWMAVGAQIRDFYKRLLVLDTPQSRL